MRTSFKTRRDAVSGTVTLSKLVLSALSDDTWLSMLCARAGQSSYFSPSPKFTLKKPAASGSPLLSHTLSFMLFF